MANKNNALASADNYYIEKEREATRRIHRKTILLNSREKAAVEEYCRRYKISNESSLIRQAVMERILEGLDQTPPSLFD